MKNYHNYLKRFVYSKYRESTITDFSFIKSFTLYREKILLKILNKKKLNEFCYNSNKDTTYQTLKAILSRKLSSSSEKQIVTFYKKFEFNLCLKKKYNSYFKKISNYETNINSYIYLGLLINCCKSIDHLQKLNCILKIIDKVIYSKNFLDKCDLKSLVKLILLEKILLESIS